MALARVFSLMCLLLLPSGCSAQQRFEPQHDSGIIRYTFQSVEEVAKFCGIGSDVVGCTICSGSDCEMHLVRERCVWDHEVDHVFFGDFHKGKKPTCKARAE